MISGWDGDLGDGEILDCPLVGFTPAGLWSWKIHWKESIWSAKGKEKGKNTVF